MQVKFTSLNRSITRLSVEHNVVFMSHVSIKKAPETKIKKDNNSLIIVDLANAPSQAEALLHSLEWVAVGIGLHVNAHKTE